MKCKYVPELLFIHFDLLRSFPELIGNESRPSCLMRCTEFCTCFTMKISMKKTKVLVFFTLVKIFKSSMHWPNGLLVFNKYLLQSFIGLESNLFQVKIITSSLSLKFRLSTIYTHHRVPVSNLLFLLCGNGHIIFFLNIDTKKIAYKGR